MRRARTLASLWMLATLLSVTPTLGETAHHAHHAHPRPDAHAPLGVMGDHTHGAGEVMLSYRYMRMEMGSNRDDTHRVSTNDVLADYPVAPYDMDMEMHMLGAMWAPHDAVTLMAMVPFVRLDMKHRTRMGQSFTTRSNGIGDVSLGGLIRLLDRESQQVHLNLGLSFPTGTITAKDNTPMGRVRLPYPMQLGSGTYDLLPGLTYNGRSEDLSWGGQARGTIRTGTNDQGYRWGDRWGATAWLARPWTGWLSTSLRLDYQQWWNLHGDDGELNPAVVPTADPDLRAGKRLDLLLGANFLVTRGPLRGHRFALEAGRPIYQHLDGPQLETDWVLTAGWQYAF